MFEIIDLDLSQSLEFIRKGIVWPVFFSKERKKCCWLKGGRWHLLRPKDLVKEKLKFSVLCLVLIHSTCACNWSENVINSARGHCPCPLPGRICLRAVVIWWGLYIRFLWHRTFKYTLCIFKAFPHCVQFHKNIFDSHWLSYPYPFCLSGDIWWTSIIP